jgi:hypothetical protein
MYGKDPSMIINPHNVTKADIARWYRMIGKRVFKHSGKPFKSKQELATVSGVVTHPITQRHAFTFSDCDGVVECHKCELHVDNPDQWTFVHRGWLEEGLDPKIVQSEVGRHLTALLALGDDIENRDEAIIAFKQLEGDVNRIIQGE